VETALAGRVAAPFTYRDRKICEMASAGIPEIDSFAGGLPRGALTEIFGPPCSGRATLLISALAERTAQQEACALIDARDGFDPQSAEAGGVALKQLLWVRCRNIEQTLRATELLLQGGGFGMVAVDLADMAPRTVRHIPLNVWFRLRRAVENTPTILLVFEQEPNAKTCASLVLSLRAAPPRWKSARGKPAPRLCSHAHAFLLDGWGIGAEVLRSRVQAPDEANSESDFEAGGTAHRRRIFQAKALYAGAPASKKFKAK
jgi:recombination protein RecA